MTFTTELEAKLGKSDDLSALLARFLNGEIDKPVAISFVNPFSYAIIAKDQKLIESVDYWFVDGALLCCLANLFRSGSQARLDRVSFDFSSSAGLVFDASIAGSLRIGLIGATANEINKAEVYLRNRYPELQIAYLHHGHFDTGDDELQAKAIINSNVDLLIVGMGTPRQERFILKVKEKLNKRALLFTCGGFLTQTGLSGDYFPAWVKKSGLRWFYRAIRHSHVRTRLMRDYPIFVVNYLISGIRRP